jgi:hypothetical protein
MPRSDSRYGVDVRMNRRGAAASVLLATLVLSTVGLSSASAEDPTFTVDEPHALSAEYGEQWAFRTTLTQAWAVSYPWTASVDFHGGPSGYHPDSYIDESNYSSSGSSSALHVGVYVPYNQPALTVGNYTMDVTVTDFYGTAYTTASPASLTVTPAALGIDLRVLADPNNSDAAIVTAKFTGRFVDEYQSSSYAGAALSPAGEWHIALKDEDGAVAIERNLERSAGDDILATSFYWTGAEPDTEYKATAEFVPTGSSAANFTTTSATSFTYTAPASQRPVPTSTATEKPTANLPEASGFGLPLWALILSIVLTLGLGALVTILSVRLSRTRTSATGSVSA